VRDDRHRLDHIRDAIAKIEAFVRLPAENAAAFTKGKRQLLERGLEKVPMPISFEGQFSPVTPSFVHHTRLPPGHHFSATAISRQHGVTPDRRPQAHKHLTTPILASVGVYYTRGVMSFGVTLATALFLAAAVILALWAIKDAMSRRKSPLLVVIAVVFFFPFGLIAWLLFRPAVCEPQLRS
jgi:hypothetical protein